MYKKHWRIQKTSADGKNSAHPKSLADGKNLAHRKILVSNVGAREKLGAHQGVFCLPPANVGAAEKVVGPAEELPDCLGSAESATADFSHAPLLVSFSSLQMC